MRKDAEPAIRNLKATSQRRRTAASRFCIGDQATRIADEARRIVDEATRIVDEAPRIDAELSRYIAEVTRYGRERSRYEPEANLYARKQNLYEDCGTRITPNENCTPAHLFRARFRALISRGTGSNGPLIR